MPRVTYTAKRDLETLAYLRAGTDISVNGTNDTFNSVTTNLAGLLDNQWIETKGFANAANNGWFQANGNSAATQITQDTSTTLVTEAAGPSITIQGYVRGLNQQYSVDFEAMQLTRSAKITKKERVSLGGNMETIRQRREFFWQVALTPVPQAQLAQWREFIHSVDGGETFTFDPYGTLASPVEPVTCDLDADSYTEERQQSSAYFVIAFRLRVQP